MISEERLEKFKKVVACRQYDLTVILENVHDVHNIGAILRSCDSVGIQEIFVINSRGQQQAEEFKGKTASRGASKWLHIHYFEDVETCLATVRQKYKKIFTTHLSIESRELFQMDFTESMALVFGNEHDGVSDEMLEICDGNFVIPQIGMTNSLNISVAVAVTLYEAFRQKLAAGHYQEHYQPGEPVQTALLEEFVYKSRPKVFDMDPTLLEGIMKSTKD